MLRVYCSSLFTSWQPYSSISILRIQLVRTYVAAAFVERWLVAICAPTKYLFDVSGKQCCIGNDCFTIL